MVRIGIVFCWRHERVLTTKDINKILSGVDDILDIRRLWVSFVVEFMGYARDSKDGKGISHIQVGNTIPQTSFGNTNEIQRLIPVFGGVFPERSVWMLW